MYEIMQTSGAEVVIVVEGHGHQGHLFGGNMAHMGIQTGVEAVFAVGDLKLTIWNGVDDSATNTWTVVPTG